MVGRQTNVESGKGDLLQMHNDMLSRRVNRGSLCLGFQHYFCLHCKSPFATSLFLFCAAPRSLSCSPIPISVSSGDEDKDGDSKQPHFQLLIDVLQLLVTDLRTFSQRDFEGYVCQTSEETIAPGENHYLQDVCVLVIPCAVLEPKILH